MRYEGTMQVMAFVSVDIDEPGLSLEDAKKKVEQNPEKYRVGSVSAIEHECWETELECTELDQPDEAD